MYRTKAIYQLSDLKQSSWKILRLFEIYRQSGSQAPVNDSRFGEIILKCHSDHVGKKIESLQPSCQKLTFGRI